MQRRRARRAGGAAESTMSRRCSGAVPGGRAAPRTTITRRPLGQGAVVVVEELDELDGLARSAFHVAWFTTPSAGLILLSCWNLTTCASVPGPKLPSGVPTS